jgi:hypothetical protein
LVPLECAWEATWHTDVLWTSVSVLQSATLLLISTPKPLVLARTMTL